MPTSQNKREPKQNTIEHEPPYITSRNQAQKIHVWAIWARLHSTGDRRISPIPENCLKALPVARSRAPAAHTVGISGVVKWITALRSGEVYNCAARAR